MLKPYKEYRYFGLPWLEEVPSHWAMLRNKNVLIEKKEVVGSSANNYLLLSLTLNGVIARDMINAKGKFPKDFNTYKVVEPGNLIFCLFDIDETPRTVGLSTLNGMITGAYDVFQPVNINGKYLYYYYLSIDNVKGLKPLYTGLRKVINIQTFLATKLPVPSKEEQEQIVRYLDWKLIKINKLIRAKKKQIVLLNEQKQVIINNAVTKGLDPNVPMKDSGIEWIGQIPIHWNVIRLRGILSPVSIKNHPKLPLLSVLREKGVIVRDVKDKESNHNFIPDDLSGYKVVQAGQFVMNKMKAWQGSYGISPYTGIVSPAYFVFDVNVKNKDYFHYSIRSKVYVNFFAQASNGIRVGQWDLNISKMKDIPFIVPSEEEQTLIIDYIKRTSKDIEVAITRFSNEIKLLQEYRTRLISDVVTGKVDVRDIEIPEYEADSDETIDDEIDDNLVLDEEDGEMEVE
jgi:type I restriction enzyme S subunit